MNLAAQTKEFPGIFPPEAPRPEFEDAEYLAVVCHEIGTPLTSIIGLSHVLSDVECSPQKKKECAEMLRDSSTMLMDLMKNMLDSSRLNAGMIEIEELDFDPVKVVQETVHIIATRAAEKGLDLYVHITNGLPMQCIGDPLRIRQILLNLLSNAVKFTERGHVALYVNAKRDGRGNDQLCVTVADTGIGICKDSLKKIFGKYTQARTSRKYDGTGLGLCISQKLAHLMHGDITVKSWPGMGSHFIVTLPLKIAPALLATA